MYGHYVILSEVHEAVFQFDGLKATFLLAEIPRTRVVRRRSTRNVHFRSFECLLNPGYGQRDDICKTSVAGLRPFVRHSKSGCDLPSWAGERPARHTLELAPEHQDRPFILPLLLFGHLDDCVHERATSGHGQPDLLIAFS
ncbi:hypothetical protein CVT26_008638 [Gymnopilus dilepis]|uniref:Uncharacterized protein n=1 Tax=Gymnopilus dilepis TaxID=231916 RepID=A0A409XXW9_9AGAR|nr:hypothetical protein CVT26_008638 [Gymnopilus dilepis]